MVATRYRLEMVPRSRYSPAYVSRDLYMCHVTCICVDARSMDLTWLTHVWPLTWLIHSALKSCCEAAAAPLTPTAPPTCRCVPLWRRVRRKWRQIANMSSSFPSLEMSLRLRSYYITTVIYIYTYVHLYAYLHISIHTLVYFRENEDRRPTCGRPLLLWRCEWIAS